jgi:hypothetical protein
MKRHVKCFVEKAGFEPRTLGTKAECYDHWATRPAKEYVLVCTLYLQTYETLIKRSVIKCFLLESAAAMATRLTRGCGSSGVATNLAWVD